ncbi:PucR family transcriptional regulator ligand-binding domain-containing protein [Brevibacillus ruminantium]|uniref:PucR family transcriptional regulator ligand-binding domain-containing protein n=1 Tax=Brevibacillus ruminantium TaxID=2950604 RepID=A0ABY4WSN8_9BACL|nr:PucR family transcriptional regulator [Brevibacillus ruminantium]USG67616.1 PucR family transcriptional regulator ligand-binding domain-containing protein [Brevibacillus ruminantium]
MAITVKNLMKIGGLRQCKVVAGHLGLEREVKLATIMEVPDIVRWLKGDELILTSLFPIKDDPVAQKQLVRQLHEIGTAALAIKPHRFVDEIPASVLEEADRYALPVIEIPEAISYLDILPPVMNAIFDRKVVLQEDLEQASRLLHEISLNEQGMEPLIEALGMLTKNTITVESLLSYMRVPSLPFSVTPLTSQQLKELAIIKRPVRLTRQCEYGETDCIVAPIMLDGHVYGNITCWAFDMEHLEMDLAVLEKASTLLALEFLRLKVRFDVEQQYKSDFLRELFINENLLPEDVRERGRPYGFSLDTAYVCLVLQFTGQERGDNPFDLGDRAERLIRHSFPETITGFLRQAVYCLCAVGAEESDDVIKKKTEAMTEPLRKQFSAGKTFRLGIGRNHGAGLAALQESFREAEKAILLGSAMPGKPAVIHFNDLGIYRLLAQLRDQGELRHFYDQTVGKLFQYDRNSDLELVKTLRIYFQHNETLTETAQALFIHVNTLKYRIRRIEKISGHSLQQSEGKLMLHLGLKIAELIRDDYRFH